MRLVHGRPHTDGAAEDHAEHDAADRALALIAVVWFALQIAVVAWMIAR